ncbi:MAG TPA: alpha/beta hydrolase [Cyclobacteriaceae bacterium]
MRNIYLIMIVAASAITSNVYSQSATPVNWIHGLGETDKIWKNYAPLFEQERIMTSNTPVYYDNDRSGVVSAKNTLDNRMTASASNILIGHSMGGLVAREYERNYGSSLVRGIVTVTSPNQGATVANQIISGNAQTIINRGIADLSAGPVADGKTIMNALLTSSLTGIPTTVTNKIINKKVDAFLKENLFVKVSEFLANEPYATLEDFKVNGTYINGLNAYTARVPIVNIICEENDKAALRIANSAISPPEDATLNQYEDGHVATIVDRLREIYKGRRIFYDVAKWTNPLAYSSLNSLANKWQRGENYLGSVYEADYNTLIGATRTLPVTTQVLVQVCNTTCSDPNARVAPTCPPPTESDCHYEYQNVTTYQVVTTASDGLLPNWTQRMPKIADDNVYTAVGVNHLEVGNHPEIEKAYRKVFDRTDQLRVLKRQ